ncbi:MAG: hypothetical protein HRU19_25215 [Pseudobacteriovorax sp.]|nr:hypothetical protein [Pseudobacteriovorax sp.]
MNRLFFCCVLVMGCGQSSQNQSHLGAAWDRQNNPKNFGVKIETTFSNLPLKASLERIPWSGHFWPTHKGGIARRWQTRSQAYPWQYASPNLSQLKAMTATQINNLSPTEKYDIYRGLYSYPLTNKERARTGPEKPKWWGICHGRSSASLIHSEPNATRVTNADGIAITFTASDLKALLSHAHAKVDRERPRWRYIGFRCNDTVSNSTESSNPKCNDTNAGGFHLALVHQIAKLRQGFILDKTRDAEVWNRPVFAYHSVIESKRAPSPNAAETAIEEYVLHTDVEVTEMAQPNIRPLRGANVVKTLSYRYTIEVDKEGKVVGGAWLSWQRPDFLWKASFQNANVFLHGEYAALKGLMEKAGSVVILPGNPEPEPVGNEQEVLPPGVCKAERDRSFLGGIPLFDNPFSHQDDYISIVNTGDIVDLVGTEEGIHGFLQVEYHGLKGYVLKKDVRCQ